MNSGRVSILYVDMNSYFASVEQQENAALRGKPVAVVTTVKPNAAIIAASYEAKAHGLKFGVRCEEASRIVPGIQFRPARHDVYVDYHHRIKAAVSKILPIDDVHSVDEVSCKLTGDVQNLDQALSIAEKIRTQIYLDVGTAMRCSIGLGNSLLLAKLAGELIKPEGLDWLTSDVMPTKVEHLELKDIPGISKGIKKRLIAAGIETIAQLYALTPKHARKIWGNVQGERFIRAFQGEDIPLPVTTSSSLGHGQILGYANRTPEGARLVARRLLIKAATRLRRKQAFTTFLHVSVTCSNTGRRSVGQRILATQDSFQLLALFRQFWGKIACQNPKAVSVMLGGLMPIHMHTADLFENRQGSGIRTQRETLCSLVDHLNQRFGQDTLIYGERPKQITPYTGAKIAFGRIPTKEEFRD